MKDGLREIVRPVLLAMVCGLALASLYYGLQPTIQQSRDDYEARQLATVHGLANVNLVRQSEALYHIHDSLTHELRGQVHASSTLRGYNGRISAWIAVDTAGEVLGVRIREHRETPGLGDKIEKRVSDWIDVFVGMSLSNTRKQDWALVKEGGRIDQFTGATITPQAVVQMVHEHLITLDDERVSDAVDRNNREE